EEKSIKKQQSQELLMIVERLPNRYRNLVKLRYYEELSYEEIATQLDLPLGTVKAQLFRARDLLAKILDKRSKHSGSEI
ncbi:MAG: sigma-70 family RNA polymerase sigma factor, partial [Mucilaginibacter polytrichastri]|nr:sigma-70 family RNA polymerase sigma factor [Mucilaginibacter polytrichastri]